MLTYWGGRALGGGVVLLGGVEDISLQPSLSNAFGQLRFKEGHN